MNGSGRDGYGPTLTYRMTGTRQEIVRCIEDLGSCGLGCPNVLGLLVGLPLVAWPSHAIGGAVWWLAMTLRLGHGKKSTCF